MANIKDVAKLADLSVGTVSRVINNRGYISAETRQKVNDAMKQLDYVPNELAKSIFRKYTKIIGVIVPYSSHPYFAKLVESIELCASQKNYKVMLCDSCFEKDKEIEYFKMMRGNKVDGIVLCSRSIDLGEILSDDLPVVSIDRILGDNIPCVAADNYQGGKLATQYLIDKGCKKIVHISGSPALHLMANLRTDAYTDTCRLNGLKPLIVPTDEKQFTSMAYYSDIRKMFETYPDVDGIFASSDVIGAQVIQAAAKVGRRVPEDIRVVGFDGTYVSQLTTPPLTTVRQPIEQIGEYAVELLISKIGVGVVPMRTILPVTLIERDT